MYDLTYVYDAGGNRLAKTDSVNARRVDYHYDLYDQENPPPDPHPYESDNNRLMYYEMFDTTGGPEADVLLSTTWYYYGENGNPTRIVTVEADSPDHYEAMRFG